MKVLVTGGAGFVGQRLIATLLQRKQVHIADSDGALRAHRIDEIVCADLSVGTIQDPLVRNVIIDMGRPDALSDCLDKDTAIVFHLAAVVSGSAEADLELGLRVNLDGIRTLLSRCADLGHKPHLVFSSSIAVYGVGMPTVVRDDTPAIPLLSYGAQKLCAEMLVFDYNRRGVIRGCSVRLPAVIARAGVANGAATGFSSAIWREPLAGRPYALPVPRTTRMWCASPGVVANNLIHALSVSPSEWTGRLGLNLPGHALSMLDCIAALKRVMVEDPNIQEALDPVVSAMSTQWPSEFDTQQALALGFERDVDADSMLAAYIASHPEDIKVSLRAASPN